MDPADDFRAPHEVHVFTKAHDRDGRLEEDGPDIGVEGRFGSQPELELGMQFAGGEVLPAYGQAVLPLPVVDIRGFDPEGAVGHQPQGHRERLFFKGQIEPHPGEPLPGRFTDLRPDTGL